ncbi:Retrovirus-related Pol polyprotein from transposon RE1 [Vitis vinifera]|uniref:Retrovirus-related Pol polyprotein from transposon RE1 n=1 Tax=Vitis vinifera TaxID=29760 RepID=A0A438FKK9_VITVI|nr:Retrovirus-related Pol polyprotein from transposon RE1 [Vitis vinifera]
MNEEMKSLQKNETWELVECPPGKKLVGCRWIYTVKYKTDGSIERFKARLVAKGYTQTYGIDCTETFALVAKINTVPVLLSLVANLDWPLQQFDVKNAFLHGELSEEVYMDLPLGCMVSENQCQKVCKLKKSLYGLKQSPRAWFGRFTKSMRAFGYRQSNSDHTLFLKKQHSKITTLIVYVDDMVVIGNDHEERKALQNYLSREFEMKDLGPLKYFLGIEVSRSSEGIFLSQRKYVLDLLQETGMLGCQPVNTPIEEGEFFGIHGKDVQIGPPNTPSESGGTWAVARLAHWSPDSMAAHVLLRNPDGVALDSIAARNLLGNPDSNARSVSSGGGVPTPYTRRQSPLLRAGYLIAGWERRTFQLPRSAMSGSSMALTRITPS